MNVYSELLELLTAGAEGRPAGLFGTLTADSPLTVTVRGTALTEGLFYSKGRYSVRRTSAGNWRCCPARRAFGSSALWEVGAHDLSRLGHSPDTAPEEALPLFREWAVDWENGCFALRRGEPYLVSGDEALKIWVARRCGRKASGSAIPRGRRTTATS